MTHVMIPQLYALFRGVELNGQACPCYVGLRFSLLNPRFDYRQHGLNDTIDGT